MGDPLETDVTEEGLWKGFLHILKYCQIPGIT
jgi:hypothetical protein